MTSKRQQKEEVRRRVLEGLCGHAHVIQVRPNTVVMIVAELNGRSHQAYGFSKVTYRDVWNPQTGMEIAIKKAVAKIVKAAMAGEHITEMPFWLEDNTARAMFAPAVEAEPVAPKGMTREEG